jgi:tetratricopeptide (TPR) repeat protein/arylsulfatase A-like enzyme
MAKRLARRLLLVGWDAADWKIISPLLDAGRMPALGSLIERGCMGNITTLNPPLSPILWTSIVTGKWPFKHGIRGFIEPIEEEPGVRPVSSTSRTTKALWNICHQAGLSSHAIGFWASHPAEPISGVCVSDQFLMNPPEDFSADWPLPPDSVHPEKWQEVVGQIRVHPGEIKDEDLRQFIPRIAEIDRTSDKHPAHLAEALAKAASVQAVLVGVLQNEPWEFVAAYFDTIDVLSHHFMPFHPPKMPNVSQRDFDLYSHVMSATYVFHDMMLANLLAHIEDDTAIILLSDHGFHSDHLRPTAPSEAIEGQPAFIPDAAWHRPMGILCAAGPGIRRDERIYGASLLDVTPLALTILGLPLGKDMDGKVLGGAFEEPVEIERIESWDQLEGDAGQHPPDKRQQPFDQTLLLRHLAELGYVEAPREDIKKNSDLAIREGNYNFAISYMEAGRASEALKLIEPVYQSNPDRPRFATTMAQCLLLMGRSAESAEILERLIAESGSTPDRDLLLGAVRFNMGRKEEAVELVSDLARKQPADPRVHFMLGEMCLALQRYEEGAAAMKRSIDIDESNARAHNHLAAAYLGLRKYEEAFTAALHSVGIVHHQATAHMRIGIALTHMKEFKRAIGPLELALRMDPTQLEAHRYLATVHRELNNWDLAKIHRSAAEDLMAKQGKSPPNSTSPS